MNAPDRTWILQEEDRIKSLIKKYQRNNCKAKLKNNDDNPRTQSSLRRSRVEFLLRWRENSLTRWQVLMTYLVSLESFCRQCLFFLSPPPILQLLLQLRVTILLKHPQILVSGGGSSSRRKLAWSGKKSTDFGGILSKQIRSRLCKCFLAAAGFLPCEKNFGYRFQIMHRCKCFCSDLRSRALVQMFQSRFYNSWDFYGLSGRGLLFVNGQTRCFLFQQLWRSTILRNLH